MRKLVILFLVVCLTMSSAFAQDAKAPNRTVSVYFDSLTGGLVGDGYDAGVLAGNEFEVGVAYTQNFSDAPWLSMQFRVNSVMQGNVTLNEDGAFAGYNSASASGQPVRARAALIFGPYAFLSLDTRGVFAVELYSPKIDFGNAGGLSFMGAVEGYYVPYIDTVSSGVDAGKQSTTVLDIVYVRADYSITFAEDFIFASKLGFRFPGWLKGNEEVLSGETLVDNFRIRWENQVIWNVTEKFYIWTQLRYEVQNIVNKDVDIENYLALQGGLGYSFNFNNN